MMLTGKLSAARNTFKFLQTLYRYAQHDQEDLQNPVDILSRKKLWNKKTRRDTFIKPHQFPAWFKAVKNVGNDSIRDALLLLMFTGLRKNEAFTLRWEYVDLKDKTFKIPDTKNKKPHELPMSDYIFNLLSRRKQNAGDSKWVFPGDGKHGHITEVKAAIRFITEQSDVTFMLHDLRRTFSTIAETLSFSSYVIKRLLNHSASGDVTAGYIQVTTERLRVVIQQITNEILRLAEQK